jgi:hypothetical protein
MTYITSANRTVLFGGNFNEAPYYFGDTWEWDGDGWVQVSDTGPTPRASPKLAYDADRNVAVLFGGYANGEHVFDTWEWDSQGWVQVGDTGPKAQGWEAAMVYDTARKLTTLEGGSIRTKGVGTWTWDGASWTQVADTGPELRANFPLAFDSTRERAVLFGGASPNVFEPKRDTWEWDGDAWTEVDDIGPPARQAHAMTWKGDDVVLFGGTAQQFSEGSQTHGNGTASIGDSGRTSVPTAHTPPSCGTAQEAVSCYSVASKTKSPWVRPGKHSSIPSDTNQPPSRESARKHVLLLGGLVV